MSDEYKTYFTDPTEDDRPVCLACLRAVGVDPVADGLQPARGPCWACAERRAVVGQSAEGKRCMVCGGGRARTPVRVSVGARAAVVGHLCRACAGPVRTLIKRGTSSTH